MKNLIWKTAIWFATILSLVALPLISLPAFGETEELVGPAFLPSSPPLPMSPPWQKRPISRKGFDKNAILAVTLDQQLYPALLPLILEYAKSHKLNISVREGTCGISAGKIRSRSADIGGYCCPPGNLDRLPGLVYHTLGIAALAIIANKNIPVDTLELQQVRDIFQGKIGLWNEVIQDTSLLKKTQRIRPVGRLHCKARPGHWRLILDNEDLFSPRLLSVSTINDMISYVADIKGAIGFETLWMIQKHKKVNKVKILRLNNYDPREVKNLINGHYLLYRTYSLTTWSKPPASNKLADELVAYLKRNFDRVDKKYGFISTEHLRKAGWKFNHAELVGEIK